LITRDLGDGLPFRSGVFDGAVSISAIQWLCNADKTSHSPVKRLRNFFESLFSCMKRSAKVVLQFYPESASQIDMITSASLKSGFTGGLVVDYPHSTRAKKFVIFLLLLLLF
jgi:18S rRNA (guanine1575-N7)-methyltransferase